MLQKYNQTFFKHFQTFLKTLEPFQTLPNLFQVFPNFCKDFKTFSNDTKPFSSASKRFQRLSNLFKPYQTLFKCSQTFSKTSVPFQTIPKVVLNILKHLWTFSNIVKLFPNVFKRIKPLKTQRNYFQTSSKPSFSHQRLISSVSRRGSRYNHANRVVSQECSTVKRISGASDRSSGILCDTLRLLASPHSLTHTYLTA